MPLIDNFNIRALNDAETSENRIHSDEIAARYGFSGALVSGVNVFGYLTQALARHVGGDLLERTTFDVKFLKPAYHDEQLRISTEELATDSRGTYFFSCALNAQGSLLAVLETALWNSAPEVEYPYPPASGGTKSKRSEIHWARIHLLEPAADFLWTPLEQDNLQRVNAQRDTATLYRGSAAYIHPYYLLDACNKALMRMFILPAWIHTGSQLTIRRPIRIGQQITVRSVPTEKWERKGHQFIRLAIAMIVEGEPAATISHTAIFRIATE